MRGSVCAVEVEVQRWQAWVQKKEAWHQKSAITRGAQEFSLLRAARSAARCLYMRRDEMERQCSPARLLFPSPSRAILLRARPKAARCASTYSRHEAHSGSRGDVARAPQAGMAMPDKRAL